jgi:hypothetical protein
MNTLVIVLSAVLGQAEEVRAPLWRQDYTQAQKVAAQDKKPMAVFLKQGQNGISKLVPGGLNEQAKQLLANNYVTVSVDTATPEGQRLARAFEIRDGQGLILSDRGGTYQAFWSQGTLTNQDLVRNLEKYASQTDVRMTEVAGRSSLYPPVDEQGSPVRQIDQRGYQVSTTPTETQRRRGLRNSEQRGRLFQGRLSRRTAN